MSKKINVGIYVDGTFWFHLTHYWLHAHPMRKRLDLAGVHDAIRFHAHKSYGEPLDNIKITQRHHFESGRGSANPKWTTVLQQRLAYQCHQLGYDHINDREVGVDVAYALTCWDTAGDIDMVALLTGDGDHYPLAERLTGEDRRVLVPSIQARYVDARTGKQRWLHTGTPLRDAATDNPTWEELLTDADGVDGLISPFLDQDPNHRGPKPRARR